MEGTVGTAGAQTRAVGVDPKSGGPKSKLAVKPIASDPLPKMQTPIQLSGWAFVALFL